MAKKPQPHELTPEQKAAQLKPREHQLGGAEVHTGDESIIGWESTLNEAPVSAEASSPTTGQEPSHLSSHTIDERQSESRLPVSGLKNALESQAHHPVPPSSELSRPAGRLVDQPLVSGHDTTAFYGSVSADPKTAEVSPLSWQADAADSQPSGDIPSAISRTLSPQVLAAHDEQSPPTDFQLQGMVQGEVTEDQGVDAYGALTVTGHPSSDLQWYVASRQGVFGTLDIDQQGQWHYQLENSSSKVQALVAGQSMAESFVVLVADNTGVTHMTRLQIRVNGSNDLPVMAVVTPRDTHEGGLAVHGQLSATDLDAGDQLIFSAAHPVAGFVLHDDGQYVFDPSSPVYDHLKSGEQQILDIPVAVTDRQGAQDTRILRIILTGCNDVPALQAEVRSAQEDVPPLHGQLLGTDPDRGDTLVYSTTLLVPRFSLHTDGSYSFDPGHASYQHLAAGQVRDVVIPITVTDSVGASSTQSLTIKLTGSNDGATIAGVSSGSTSEDNTQAVTGQLTITDMDDGEAYFVAQSGVVGTYGTFTMNEQGQWRYQLDNRQTDVQSLKTGDQVTDSFTITSADGTTHTVSVSVAGRDDGAVIAGVDAATLNEDVTDRAGKLAASGQLTVIDPDAGQDHFTPQIDVAGSSDLGHFSLDTTGAWTYTADNTQTAIQQLKSGELLTDSLTVTSADGTTHALTVTILGANDAPVLQAQTQAVTEDGALLTGQMVATDVDAGDMQTFSFAQAVDGFTLNADGSYRFDPGHASYQHLAAGQTQDVVIPITVTDSAGAISTQNLTLTVTGLNDGAVIGGVNVGSVREEQFVQSGYLQASGQLTISDADTGESHFTVQTDVAGSTGVGHFSLDTSGAWIYTADNYQSAIQQLKTGDSLTDSLTVHSADGTAHTITVTLQGMNDVPVLSAQSQAVTEDGTLLSGHMVATDVDAGDTEAFSTPQNVDGFTLNADGSYSFDPCNASYQHLSAGQTQDVVIPITVIDSASATSKQNLTITVTGVNDGAVIGGVNVGSVSEDTAVQSGQLQASGQLTISDVDSGEAHFTAQTDVAGSSGLGHFNLDTSGAWTYTTDNSQTAIQQLKASDSLTDSLTVTSADGTTHTITVTIQGTNDTPLLVVQRQAVTEDGAMLTGHMVATDADAGDTQTFSTTAAVDGFTLNADGSYSFDPSHASYQHLAAGQTQDVVIPISVTDSAGATSIQNLSITVTGVNDGAVIGGVNVATVTEDTAVTTGHLQASGQLTISDADTGEAHFTTQTDVAGSAGYGHFSVDSAGAWTYSADNTQAATQQLKAGDSLTDTLTVTSADGTTHTLTVTIQGTNDAPVLAAQSQAITEDGTLLSGHMVATDVDAGDTKTFSTTTAVDGFTLNADGSYQFDPAHVSYQHLAAGQTQDVVIPITVTDSAGATSTQNLTITVTGSNDAPDIGSTRASRMVFADAPNAAISGLLHVRDADASDTQTWTVSGNGQGRYGHLDFDAQTGRWTYQLDKADADTQALKAGEQGYEAFQITVTDGHGGTDSTVVRVMVVGTNDTPVLAAQSQAVTEDGTLLSGQMVATDADAGDTQTFSTTTAVDGFTLNADGSYRFDLSHASYQHMAAGQTQDLVIPVTVTDSAGATSTQNLTITVTGSADGAVIGGVDLGMVTEDTAVTTGHLQASGQLIVSDVDSGEAHFTVQTNIVGSHGFGHFSVDAAGAWTYTADDSQTAIQQLKAGESLTDTLTVASADGTTHTLTMTIQGMNDAPVLAAQTQAVTEDGTQLSGHMVATDADAGDTQTFSSTQPVDGFTLNADGSYRFDPSHASYQHLAVGQTQDVVIPITVSDSAGATSTQSLTITITGSNDAPSVTGVDTGRVVEDQTLSVRGKLAISDADDGQAHFVAQTATAGSYGSLTIGEDGQWQYQLDNSKAEVQALMSTETATDSFTVDSADGSSYSITITIQGQRDSVVIGGVDVGVVKEDLSSVTGGNLVATGESAEFVALQQRTTLGNFAMDASGAWTYTLDNSRAGTQALKTGETATDTVTITHTDGTTHTVTVTVMGTNDAPVLSAQTQAITEDGTQLTGHMAATDVDAGDPKTFSSTQSVDGFTLNADGSYSFDPSHASYQHLAAGQTQDVVIPITVTDSTGLSSTQNLTITVTGVNDGAVISGVNVATLAEDTTVTTGHLQASGQLTISDADTGEAHFTAQADVAGSGSYGHFSVDTSGTWTYTADNSQAAIQQLKAGESLTDTLTVASADGTTHTLTVTLQGTNDAPGLAAQTQAVTEDGTQLSGHMVATDADAGDTQTFSSTQPVDGFTLNADGSYSFDPSHASYQHLAVGQTQDVVIPITVTDSTGLSSTQNLTITVTGVNDGTTVTGAHSADITEDANLLGGSSADADKMVASGRLSVVDVDSGEAAFVPQAQAGSTGLGVFHLGADGQWRYLADPGQPAIQALKNGQTLNETAVFHTVDGTPVTLTVTIHGTEDRAVISGVDSATLTEDHAPQAGQLQASGSLIIVDPDRGDAMFMPLADMPANQGLCLFSIDANGHWTYAVDNSLSAIQQLKAGQSLTETLTVTSGDGSTHSLTVAIHGSNDSPVLQAQTQAVTEDGTQLSGQMVATDADASDTQTFSLANAVDGFTLNAGGSYSFDPSHASYQHLAAGQTQDIIIPITVTDGSGLSSTQNLTITVTGSNDGPLVTHGTAATAADQGAINEDTPHVFSEADLLRLVGASDVDDSSSLHIVDGSLTCAHGTFSGDAAHGYTFTPAANFSGQDVELQFSISDGTASREAFATLDITPVADAPDRLAGHQLLSNFDDAAGTSGWRTNSGGQIRLEGSDVGGQGAVLEGGSSSGVMYQNLDTFAGQRLHVTFDLMAANAPRSTLEVVWEGKVVASLSTSIQLHGTSHHALDLVASGPDSRLEFRAADNPNHPTAVKIDNIGLTYVDVRSHREAVTNHDLQLQLGSEFRLTDSDGSESLHYLIKGLPVGFTLTDGTHNVTVGQADQEIDTRGWQQDALRVQAPHDYTGAVDLQVTARSEEAGNQQTADAPLLPMRLSFESADVLTVAEDTPKSFSSDKLLAQAGLVHPPGQHLSLSDVQVDAALGHFSHNSDGSWTFTPAANVSADQVPITLTATGGTQVITALLSLTITPVVDAPVGALTINTDFDHQAVDSSGWAFVDATGMGWHTDYAKGIEVGQDKLYGGTSSANQVLELVANTDKNIYRDLPTTTGQALHFGFDLSARAGSTVAPLEVVWEGKVIDTITPGSSFGLVHHDYDLVATGANSRLELRATGGGDGHAIIDNIAINPPPVVGLVNHAVSLDVGQAFQLADTDGSETISYLIKDLPVGATLSDGSHSVTVSTAGQVIDTQGWQLAALTLQAPKDFEGQLDFKVSARAEEGATHETALSADQSMRLRFEHLETAEDTPKTFSESELLQLAGIRAPAGQSYTLSDVQVDSAFGHFTHDADGKWTFTPAANVSADAVPFTLHVTGGAQPITATLPLNITPVADAPVHEASTGGSGQAISTDFNSVAVGGDGWAYVDGAGTGWHTDYAKGIQVGQDRLYGGSSSNQIVELNAGAGNNIYRNLPTTAGQILHFGFDLSARAGNSVATLEVVWEGKVIDTITPASGFALMHHAYDLLATGANSRLELRATGGGDGRAIIDNIDIGAPVDPLLAQVNHDLHLNLMHELHLADTDGSETLTYIVKGLPVGFTLTDGTHSTTVATAGQVIETTGWDQDALMVRAPQDYAGQLAIQVSARAEETGNHQTATSADMTLSLSFENPSTTEDTPKTFTASQLMQLAGIKVPAGQTYTVDDVQVDPAFGQVTHDANGCWTFTPAANVSADAVPLSVHVIGGAQPLSGTVSLNITPVVDAPVLEVGSGPQPFNFSSNFDQMVMGSDGWTTADPTPMGWHTDHSGGVEMATEKVYGGSSKSSVAVGLIANAGANLFRDVPTLTGQAVHLSFDLSARPSFGKSPIEVLWEGKVIDTITPSADGFAMVLHDYDLVATGSNSRIELRASGSGDQRVLLDNLQIVGLPTAQQALVNHDFRLNLSHDLHLADTDGSETLTYIVKGLPIGFTLTDGTHSVTVATAGQVIETVGWMQDALMLRPPRDFHGDVNLQVSARAEETANHQMATSADMGLRISFERLETPEDTPLTLSESKLLALAGVVPAAGEHLSLTDVQVDAAFGQFSHNADGSWTFTPAANVNADQVPFTLTVSGSSQPISSSLQLSITSVNDAPELVAQTQTVTEDGSLLRGHMVATDVDAGDTRIFSLANAVDGFTLNADGSYSFDPGHASYQHLAAGQTQDVVIPITVTDSAGAASTQSLTITVMGSDDITVISGDIATTLTEDQNVNSQGNLEHFGKLSVSASDSGTAEFVPQNAVQTQYGRYTIDQTGFWLYEADNKQEAIQQLKTGEHLTDSFTVHSADGTAQTITVTIQGQDDAARFSAVQNYSDDIYIPIGVSLMNAGPKEFLYISEVLLANQLPRNYVTAEVAITTPGGIGLRSPDGSISVIYHSTGGVANVPLMDLQAWHNKGAGYEVVVVDHPGGEIQIYAHDQGNPNLLSGFNAYVTGISNPAQASLGFNPTMHDILAASVGAAVQGAAFMPPAIAPLDFDSGHVLEDNGQQISGFIEVKDADAGQSAMTPQTDTATHYGRFSIDVNGDWVYQLDTQHPEVQQLADGQTLVDTITVLSEDGTAHEVAITIHGQNDGAAIAGADSGRVVEDDHVTATGTIVAKGLLTVTDVDAGQAAFVAQSDVLTQYGHFSLAADGHWTYTVDNSRADIQALKPGGTPGETADVSLLLVQVLGQSNETGFKAVAEALTQQQPNAAAGVLDLSIQGAAIVLSGPAGTTPVVYAMDANGRANIGVDELLSWLHQGKGYELHLQGSQSDVQVFVHDRGDAGDLHPLPLSAATALNDPASAAQHLALSWQIAPLPAELSETVTVHSVDGTEHIINLSIVGTAENAVIAGVDRGSVTEDAHVTGTGQIEAHGKLTIQDTDGGQAAFTSLHQVAGKFGHLSLQADGQWTYSADNNSPALNALNKGQSAVETFVVNSVDGTVHTLSITVNGADEKPDLWPEIARNLMAQSGGDTRGYHVIAERMAAGDSNGLRDVVMNVYDGKPTVVDASGHVLHTFDRYSKFFGYYVPMNELCEQIKAHPGAMLVLQGSVGGNANYYFHDASNEMLLNFNGAYSYEPDKRPIGGLPINGIPHPNASAATHGNTAAQLGGADSGSVLADGDALLQTQGHLTVLDADGGQAHFTAQQAVQGQYGSFSIDAQGSWHYQADGHAPALSQLAAGQQLSETFTVHSADGTSHTITVQLFGDNASAAVISGADTALLSEDQAVQAGQLRASGQLNITDSNAGQAHFIAQSDVVGSAGLGHFSLNASGAWTYNVDNSRPDIQQLKAGDTVTDTLTVSSADGTMHQITVTLSGSNDAAVITGADSCAISEDGGLSASGKLVISDVDSGQASFTPQHQAAAHGSFTLTASGDWTYTLDNHSAAVQALKTGESLSDSITVQSVDGSSHVVTVRINGANDAPVLQAQSQTVAEDGSVLRGQMQASDADHGEHLQFSTSAQVAGFSLHADGSYTFDPGHADYQSLTAGQQRDISIPVVVSDSAGDHGMQFLTLHITGRDDGAVINGVDTGQLQVGGQAQAGGQLLISDADAGPAGFQAGQIVGSFGSLSIDALGHWQYQLDTSNAQVQLLGWQDRVTDSVTIHSLDGTAHDVNIQVTGSASVPLYSSVQPHSGIDAYGNILAAVHGAGYQYQGLADALDKGDSSVVANMALSISGSHVEVIDTAGNVLQTFSPVGVDYAATMSMRDLMQWHAQGFGIIVHEDSGMDSTRMWLHNMGDPHNISVRLPDGTGFDGWADKWTFGELPLNAMPVPAPVVASDEQSVELTDMLPSPSAQVNIEVTPVAEHDAPQQLIPVSSDMTASDGVSTGVDINDDQQMGIAPHVADYWQFADLSGVAQGDKSDGHPFADQVSGYLDAAGIHVEGLVQVMPLMPPVEALIDDHVNGINDEHHMTSLDESFNDSETGEPLLAPEDPSHQHHG